MLKIENLVKRYVSESGERKGGISGVSLEVKEGELFTLLGPSGCGKTTTLRAVAGLERPDSGRISLAGTVLFDGEKGSNMPISERDLGMVFQSYAIWPHMSVFENVAYPLRVRRHEKISKDALNARVGRALEMVGLSEFTGRSSTKLSGGQQQRLALARALVREPKLLLLDEPLSNLDAQLREQMRTEIRRLQTEWGVTTIYVTHDQGEAMALSDRITVLNEGKIMQIGAPTEIYDRPNSEFVASFIGRTNLFQGSVPASVVAGSIAPVETNIGSVRGLFGSDMSAGSEVTFVVRPENVELERQPGEVNGVTQNTAEGRILERVFLGEMAEYEVDLNGRQRIIARGHPSIGLEPGDAVRVRFPEDKVVVIC